MILALPAIPQSHLQFQNHMNPWRRIQFDPSGRQCQTWLLRRYSCAVLLLSGMLHPVPSQATDPADANLTMAFIYHVAQFTEWPATGLAPSQRPLTLCMLGDTTALTPGTAAIDQHPPQGLTLRVRHLPRTGLLAGCQMLFIARSEESDLPRILRGAHASHILTLSNINGFTQAGGAVGLFGSKHTIAFDVNRAALKRAGLRISSEVLKLARAVAGT